MESGFAEQFVTHSTGNPGRPFCIGHIELNVAKTTSAFGSRRVNKPLRLMIKIAKPFGRYFFIGVVGAAICITASALYINSDHRTLLNYFRAIPFAVLFGFLFLAILKRKWIVFTAYSVGLLCCMLLSILTFYGYEQFQYRVVFKLNPNMDSSSPTHVYIPANVSECHNELDKMLSSWLKRGMKNRKSNEMNKYHFSMGLWIRNNWGLWGKSKLYDYMKSLGYTHPDDMSGAILDSYWCHLHNCDFDFSEDIDYYRRYWQNPRENIPRSKPYICKCGEKKP